MSPPADRVVVVVFDGLRPDMIAGRMPNLEAFAGESIWHREARSVFPSYTRAATTATATGCWPEQNGIVGNAFHQPAVLQGEPIDTSNFKHLELLTRSDPNGLIHTRSLGEHLALAGKRMGAVHCGSPGSAYLINHKVRKNGHWTLSALGEDGTQTPEIMQEVGQLGPLPAMDIPKFEVVDYARRAFQTLTQDTPPDVTFVWFPEPDTSYHYRQIGSEPTRAVMEAVDRAFGQILDTIRSRPGGDSTAVIAMSDHGQISTTGLFEMDQAMSADGLTAAYRPDASTKIALTRGVSGECRMLSDDAGLVRSVAEWLMQRDEIGMVFARDDAVEQIAGALPLSLVNLNHARAAELMYVMRSSDAPDDHGLPGTGLMTGSVPVGGGMHGGLNLYELNTVLMINAPDGQRGVVHPPCGLVDLAPTILELLGCGHDGMVGRSLWGETHPQSHNVFTHRAEMQGFEQALNLAQVGDVSYILEGGRVNPTDV